MRSTSSPSVSLRSGQALDDRGPRWVLGAALVTFLGAACGHTHAASDSDAKHANQNAPSGAPDKDAEAGGAKKAAPKKDARAAGGERTGTVAASARKGETPVTSSPGALLKPNAVAAIQKQLVARGYLPSDEASGVLNGRTQGALRAFQRDSGLPATGFADDAVVRKLGLAPGDIFRAANDRPSGGGLATEK
jgi:hypothetical protein